MIGRESATWLEALSLLYLIYLILAFTAFVEAAPVVFHSGLLALSDNCLLVDGGGLQAHVHQSDVGGEAAAGLGIGGWVKDLDELL